MDRLHKIYFIERKPPDGYTWSGVRLPRKKKQPQDPTMYGHICGSICLMQRKRKQNKDGLSRKTKLDNARQLRGIFFTEPDDDEFEHTHEKRSWPGGWGPPRHASNKRWRTREGPEPACVQTLFMGVARAGGRTVNRQAPPIQEVRPVKIQVRWAAAHPGQDRRLPGVVTHSRLQRVTSTRSRVGIVLEDGSGVAIDWVTGQSYSFARRRLDVQSGLRKGK